MARIDTEPRFAHFCFQRNRIYDNISYSILDTINLFCAKHGNKLVQNYLAGCVFLGFLAEESLIY